MACSFLTHLLMLWASAVGTLHAAGEGTEEHHPTRATLGMHPASARSTLAAARNSANYSLTAETCDAGGSVAAASASYSVRDASAGVVGALATATAYTSKGGYAGQLYDVVGLTTRTSPNTINENGVRQLGAGLRLDDDTVLTLDTAAVNWTVISGPVSFSSAAPGLVSAGTVYQNTVAQVRAAYQGYTAGLALTVFNVNTDDYGAYAGDGINDAWQEYYFGGNNPLAAPGVDADGTGQTNLFKYLAGLDPLDASSRFVLSIRAVAGQPGSKTLNFSPVYADRTYTVQSTTNLAQPTWTALANSTVVDQGTTRIVTDLSASDASRFYRVLISLP